MALTITRRHLEPPDAEKIGSIRSFLTQIETYTKDTEHVYFYRGHARFSYKPVPSIYRNPGWIKNEDILFKELILRCPNDFGSELSAFQTLVRMQHYSLPTRLLDITSNPLIALYFASESTISPSESGEVLVFRVPKRDIKYYDSDTVSVLSNISKRPSSFAPPAEITARKPLNDRQDIKLLIHEIRSEKPYFQEKIEPAHLRSVVCVKPKMDNARIIRQDGAFFLFGIGQSKLKAASLPTQYMLSESAPRLLVKFDEKRKVRDQLETLGITKGTIYPEIERVAEYIRDLYGTTEA